MKDYFEDFFIEFEKRDDLEKFAYFGLTQKIERPIQCEFAYYLYNEYLKKDDKKIVALEYSLGKRASADILVLSHNDDKEIIIEFKACFAEDLYPERIKKPKGYGTKILDDYGKRKEIAKQKYFVLLAAYPYNFTKKNKEEKLYLKRYIKNYSANAKHFTRIIDGIKDFNNYENDSRDFLNDFFKKKGIPLECIFHKYTYLGKALNLDCGLYCFIFGIKA